MIQNIHTPVSTRRASCVGLASQEAQIRRLEAIAQNLSNAQSIGYKRSSVTFRHLVQHNTLPSTSYTQTVGVHMDPKQGSLRYTENPLHVALTTPGYFGVKNPQTGKIFYTRDGRFFRSSEGNLVQGSGFHVLSREGSDIAIPSTATTVTIGEDGAISSNGKQIARIGVFSFDESKNLTPLGANLFTSEIEPTEISKISMVQGTLEESNVEPITESIDLIQVHRLFDSVQKIIEENDQVLRKVLNVGSKNV